MSLNDQLNQISIQASEAVGATINPTLTRIERNALRVTLLGILIFLVQILINNYRYDIRIADFYLSRSQALHLMGEDSNFDIETIMHLLAPKLEFGKQAQSPLESVKSVFDPSP